VELETHLAAALPPVSGDDVQLQQVLLNLIANACQAMATDTGSARQLLVRTSAAAGGGVQVTVADRGRGIPPEDLTRIFEPFVTSRADGMGLGLAVCRTIIRAHGGTLWAANNPEGGASFHFVVPGAEKA